jgi:hypothetical protein
MENAHCLESFSFSIKNRIVEDIIESEADDLTDIAV